MEALVVLEWAGEAIVQLGAVKALQGAWGIIRNRLRGDEAIAATLAEIEREPTPERLQQVAPFLQAEMTRDRAFAEALVQAVEALQQELPADGDRKANVQNISGDHAKGYQDFTIQGDATFQ